MQITKDILLDALNRIDELACAYASDNNEIDETGKGEATQLAEDYELIFTFIGKNSK